VSYQYWGAVVKEDDAQERFQRDTAACGRLHDRLWQLLDDAVRQGYSVEDAVAMLQAVCDGVIEIYPRLKRDE
jgi:hypothetical protein